MPIKFKCPCGRAYQVADEHAGKRVKCRACGAMIPVPRAQGKPAQGAVGRPTPPVSRDQLSGPKEQPAGRKGSPVAPRRGHCPHCGKHVGEYAVICVSCGYDFRTRACTSARTASDVSPPPGGISEENTMDAFEEPAEAIEPPWTSGRKHFVALGQYCQTFLCGQLHGSVTVRAFLQGTIWGEPILRFLLFCFLFCLSVPLTIPAWPYCVYRAFVERREARRLGTPLLGMILLFLLFALFPIVAGAALAATIFRSLNPFRAVFLIRTETSYAVLFNDGILWVPRLTLLDYCPVGEADVSVLYDKYGCAIVRVRTPRHEITCNVTKSGGRSLASDQAAANFALFVRANK